MHNNIFGTYLPPSPPPPGSHQPPLASQLYLSTHEPLPVPCEDAGCFDCVQVMWCPATGSLGVQGGTSQLS